MITLNGCPKMWPGADLRFVFKHIICTWSKNHDRRVKFWKYCNLSFEI